MILHQDNQFIYNYRAAIKMPNGMAIDYSHEVEFKDEFRFIAPDGSFKLLFGFVTIEKSAHTFTEEIYQHFDNIKAVEPIYAIKTGTGLSGYATSYDIGDELCEEFAVDLTGATHALFYARFWRLKKDEETYDNILYKEVKKELLASLTEL